MALEGIIFLHLKFQPKRFRHEGVTNTYTLLHTNFSTYNISVCISLLKRVCLYIVTEEATRGDEAIYKLVCNWAYKITATARHEQLYRV